MTSQQFRTITAWQKRVFTSATPLTALAHLKEEIEELEKDIKENNYRGGEWADCFMLLFGAASLDGLNHQDICDMLDEKFQMNIQRKWGEPNEKGYVKHIEQL